jgi:hypothetical protein
VYGTPTSIQAPDLAVVVQDLADDLRFGITTRDRSGAEGGAEQLDLEHLALLLRDRDEVADAERLREDDRQPRDQVAEHALHGERDSCTREAQAGDQRQQLHAEVLQRHDDEHPEHQQVHDAPDQGEYRRLELEPGERALQDAAGPAAGEKARRQDQQGHQQLRPEPQPHVDRRAGDLVHQLQLLSHRSSFPASLRMSNLAWNAI